VGESGNGGENAKGGAPTGRSRSGHLGKGVRCFQRGKRDWLCAGTWGVVSRHAEKAAKRKKLLKKVEVKTLFLLHMAAVEKKGNSYLLDSFSLDNKIQG